MLREKNILLTIFFKGLLSYNELSYEIGGLKMYQRVQEMVEKIYS